MDTYTRARPAGLEPVTRGLTGIRRFLLGNPSRKLAHHADTSLMTCEKDAGTTSSSCAYARVAQETGCGYGVTTVCKSTGLQGFLRGSTRGSMA